LIIFVAGPSPEPPCGSPLPSATALTTAAAANGGAPVMKSEFRNVDDGVDLSYDRHHHQQQHQQQLHLFETIKNEMAAAAAAASSSPIKLEATVIKTELGASDTNNSSSTANNSSLLHRSASLGGRLKFFKGERLPVPGRYRYRYTVPVPLIRSRIMLIGVSKRKKNCSALDRRLLDYDLPWCTRVHFDAAPAPTHWVTV
jgi:hypothetical protein